MAPAARIVRLVYLLLLPTLVASCAYGLRPGRVRAGLETVAVPYFENRSQEPDVELELTDLVVQGIIDDRSLKVVAEGDARALVIGTIRTYEFVEAFFGENRQADEYSVQAVVEVEVIDRSTGDVIVEKRRVQGNGSYLLSEGAAGEALARTELAKEIAQGILDLVLEDW